MINTEILLIDDDVEDLEIFVSVFATIDDRIKCSVMRNPRLALEKLTAHSLKPDLIFLDLNMPTMSGLQFLVQAGTMEELKKIPIVILTTSSNPLTILETRNLGAVDFITKPNTIPELKSLLENAVSMFA